MSRLARQSPDNANVYEVACSDVESFLEAISPNGPFLGEYESTPLPFVFRGVSNVKHRLVPSALRGNSGKFHNFERYANGIDDAFNQLWWEQHILRSFFQLSDLHGLAIPEDNQVLRNTIQQLTSDEYVQSCVDGRVLWPPDELLSAIAVGQHYGLPTRLLDWTRDPYIAALFAASAVDLSDDSDRLASEYLAVWLMNTYELKRIREAKIDRLSVIAESVVLVTSPAAMNDRLHAQQGLFTLFRSKADLAREANFRGTSLEDLILTMMPEEYQDPGLFWKITLSQAHARDLLRRLRRLGYSPARLFPGFEGVVSTLAQGSYSDIASARYINLLAMFREDR